MDKKITTQMQTINLDLLVPRVTVTLNKISYYSALCSSPHIVIGTHFPVFLQEYQELFVLKVPYVVVCDRLNNLSGQTRD